VESEELHYLLINRRKKTDEKRKDLRELTRLLILNMDNPNNKEINELLDKKFEEFVKKYGELKIMGF
jgi:hypothetical protein